MWGFPSNKSKAGEKLERNNLIHNLTWSLHYVIRELEALLDCKALQDLQAHR